MATSVPVLIALLNLVILLTLAHQARNAPVSASQSFCVWTEKDEVVVTLGKGTILSVSEKKELRLRCNLHYLIRQRGDRRREGEREGGREGEKESE